jgi:tryptophan synthase beta subunit
MSQEQRTSMYQELFQFPPGRAGYYGPFGGAFIPEILHETIDELQAAFAAAQADPTFWDEYVRLMASYSCRPTPVTRLDNLSQQLGGAQLYVKREDLNHTGAHKANNVMGQGLLTRRMGKSRVIAETGAGQHGVATATMAARMGFDCTVYMGALDVERQRPNVLMEHLGATVVVVEDGSQTLKDAITARCATGRSPWTRRTTSWGPSVARILPSDGHLLSVHHRSRSTAQVRQATGNCRHASTPAWVVAQTLRYCRVSTTPKWNSLARPVAWAPYGPARRPSRPHVGRPGWRRLQTCLQNAEGRCSRRIFVAAGSLYWCGADPGLSASDWPHTRRSRYRRGGFRGVKLGCVEGIIPALESAHAFVTALKEAPQLSLMRLF